MQTIDYVNILSNKLYNFETIKASSYLSNYYNNLYSGSNMNSLDCLCIDNVINIICNLHKFNYIKFIPTFNLITNISKNIMFCEYIIDNSLNKKLLTIFFDISCSDFYNLELYYLSIFLLLNLLNYYLDKIIYIIDINYINKWLNNDSINKLYTDLHNSLTSNNYKYYIPDLSYIKYILNYKYGPYLDLLN